jgi:hypothetical protein
LFAFGAKKSAVISPNALHCLVLRRALSLQARYQPCGWRHWRPAHKILRTLRRPLAPASSRPADSRSLVSEPAQAGKLQTTCYRCSWLCKESPSTLQRNTLFDNFGMLVGKCREALGNSPQIIDHLVCLSAMQE